MMEPAFRPRDYKSQIDIPSCGVTEAVQRPPVYNAEDYSGFLRKYCKLTGLQLYLQPEPGNSAPVKTNKHKLLSGKRSEKNDTAAGQPIFDKHQLEMGLKQFSSISELLNKLKIDLHLSYHSFLKEFISEPNDGVTLLLDLLKVIQLSQTNLSGNNSSSSGGNNNQQQHLHQSVFKKALADEHECLLCLKLCAEHEDGGLRLVDHPSGLFTISVCVMSNFSKSRVLALQLLTKMCTYSQGHRQVSDAVSMLRLRFGEPVRFKFLIGMLNSFSSGAFQISCLRFFNTFVETATSFRERVYIQAELEDAGFEISHLKKLVSKFGNQSDLLKEELNIWTKNYIDVNSLVTEKFMMQKTLDKAQADLDALTRKYQDLEQRHKKVLNDYNKTKAKREAGSFNDELADDGRWVEGGNSDQDSGKHSDTSLVNSSEECWAEIDKINKSYNKRQSKSHESKDRVKKDEVLPGAADSQDRNRSSKYFPGHNLRNVTLDCDQRPGGAAGRELTPTSRGVVSDADNINTSSSSVSEEKPDKDIPPTQVSPLSVSGDHDVNVVHVLATQDEDTYVEKDTMMEETIMVDNAQTIRINQADVSTQASISRPRGSKTRDNDTRVRSARDYTSSSYDEVPLPPSPRPVSKYRNRDKASRKEVNNNNIGASDSNATSRLTDDDLPKEAMKRQPRPPIRRRPRSKMIAERPKSAPPEKYDSSQLFYNSEKSHYSSSRDFSDEETSETYMSRPRSRQGHGSYGEHGESNQGTLETVSAKSFGFIRPSQRLLEREHNKRIKRHKSFFNTDTLFGKKNSLIRRAESFHHGVSSGLADYYLMNGKYYSRDARNRAKSVDRLLTAGDERHPADPLDLDKPLLKSKSMEFLKTKILRKPSKLQKKSVVRSETFLGQSMFELHRPTTHSGSRTINQLADWPLAKSSVPTSSQFCKQDVRLPRSPAPDHTGPHHDWRQDTPFWNHSRHKRKENVINWGLNDPPPSWAPPPPSSHPRQSRDRDSMTGHMPGQSRDSMTGHMYPSVPYQAVNSMYLPPTTTHHYPTSLDSMEGSMLEITELEDAPLTPSSTSSSRQHNIIQHPTARILEMPSGLY